MRSRTLALVAVVGQLVFVLSWVIAGFAEPGYSTADQTVSELFSRPAVHPWIIWIGLVALVPSYLAVAALARRVLAPRGMATVVLFILAVPLVLVVLTNPLDCMTNGDPACAARVKAGDISDTQRAHYLAAVLLQFALAATPFTAAWAARGRHLARVAFGIGVLGLAAMAAYTSVGLGEPGFGLAQRAMFAAVTLWIVVLATAAVRGPRDRVGAP